MVLQGENIVSGGSSLQIGTRFVFTGNTSPIGCMLCDGRALSRTNYAVLFSVIGTIYGSGDGSTTFNIPDYSAEPETWYIKVSNYGILPVNAIDDTQITNSNTFSAEYINNKTQTLRYNANFTLPTFLDGTRVRLVNTHETNTIPCTLPSGQTMNGQSSFTIAPDTLLEFELIGTSWKCVSNEWELFYTFTAFSTGLSIDFAQYKTLRLELYTTSNSSRATRIVKIPTSTIRITFWENWGSVRYGGVGVLVEGTTITGISTMVFQDATFESLKIYGIK